MKINKKSFLRFLTILSFLIFILPFFQMCGFKKVAAVEEVEISSFSDTIQKVEPQKPIEKADVAVDKSDDKITLNAYEIAFLIKDIKHEEVKDLSVFKDKFFYVMLCYVFLILVSVFMVFWAFKNKYKNVFYSAIINIILLLIGSIIWLYPDFKEIFEDIKYGQYVFLLNTLLISLFSYQNSKSTS
jgi:magnesium-transporting ATPase (P-type)